VVRYDRHRPDFSESGATLCTVETSMKVASFNINNINRRPANLLDWLREAEPDVVCVQELKAADNEFPATAIRRAGYHAVWRGEKRWNGVAILARWEPIVTRVELPGDPADGQSRYLEAAVNGVLVASIYAPNGNPQPGPKFDYKLGWLRRLAAHAAELYATGAPVVLAGDYNVVPTALDIYPTKSWDRDALLQPESRAAYQRLLSQGWTDAVRALHPNEPMYTFWDYMRKRWERDGGLRLDHLLLSPALAERLEDAGVDRDVRGLEDASDHAPVWVKLRDAPNRRTAPGRRSEGGAAPARATASPRTDRSTRQSSEGGRTQSREANSVSRALSGRPLLVIDGDSFAHRSYHALPKTIRRSDGKAAGAILGFANFLLRTYADERPRAVVVGWDTLGVATRRHALFPAYQSGRDFDDDLIEQLDILPEFVEACGFANAKAPGFEADDFLAAAVAAEEHSGGAVLVASGDRDSFQLASRYTTILYPSRGGDIARIGPEEVNQRYGVDPKQVPDFIALRGDPSDKLPGAIGVGPKRAAQLVRRYGSLDGVLDGGFFRTQAEALRLYKLIATMDASAPLPLLSDQAPAWASASRLARNWGLKQLADRYEKV
jgi:exodeoxyribonuclease-3